MSEGSERSQNICDWQYYVFVQELQKHFIMEISKRM